MKQTDFPPLVLEAAKTKHIPPPLVLLAAKTKQIDIKSVADWRIEEADIFLELAVSVVVRVEISSLPAGLIESLVPIPETTQVVDAAQPPAKVSKKRSKAKRGKERV